MSSRQIKRSPSSFRDPSGYVYESDGQIYRQIESSAVEDFDRLICSGLYQSLTEKRLLIPHEPVEQDGQDAGTRCIKPAMIPFVSYPFEWCPSQLKDAALLTLMVAKAALASGMVLKDATAYNVQFLNGKPIFIDTLSFERYAEGSPWHAYGQFCRHFVAPLALMTHVDLRLGKLLASYIDGLPLDLVAKLLPAHSMLNLSLSTHIHAHSLLGKLHGSAQRVEGKQQLSKFALDCLLDNLSELVSSFKIPDKVSHWSDYYQTNSYSRQATEIKSKIVTSYIEEIKPAKLWDLGSNTGQMSRLSTAMGINTVSIEQDPLCVDLSYRDARKRNDALMLPLLIDLTNPTPSFGWAAAERQSLIERGPVDCVMMLALVHHLVITNGIPFTQIMDLLSKVCSDAIVEFVPREDQQAQVLLSRRTDGCPQYCENNFVAAAEQHFTVASRQPVGESGRVLYHLRKQ